MIFISYMFTLFFCVCVCRLNVFSVPLHALHPTPSCVCVYRAHSIKLSTHLASASPHRQTDSSSPLLDIVCVCLYIQIEKKKLGASLCAVYNKIDISRKRKACQFPHAGNTIYKKKKRIASILLLFGWGGRQFHEHNLLS
jgi:hypothetical protein